MKDIVVKKVENSDEFQKTLDIRKEVFISEQKVDEDIEIDGLDKESLHFILFYKGFAVGCARIRVFDDYVKFERIAVLKKYRKKGLGRFLTKFMIDFTKKLSVSTIVLHSQVDVIGFYEKFGFEKVGKAFFEADIKHFKMIRDV